MSLKFNVNDSVGKIVTVFPGASDIFYKYNIDFCCGGDKSLIDAISSQGLDENKILAELNDKYQKFVEQNSEFKDWAKESPGKLIDYIVNKHHAYLRENLPLIGELVYKILKVHGGHHSELFKVHKLFGSLRLELEGHIVKEEDSLFPLIKQYEREKSDNIKEIVENLINETEQEHTGAGDIIKELREVTDHYSVPEDGCRTYELTYMKLKELESDLFQHIHLENNILFKNFHE